MAADGGTKAKAIPEHGWAVIDGGSPAPDDSGSVEFFRDALNALPAAVAIVDQAGRLSAANRLWLTAAGGVLLGRQWGLGEDLLRAAELVQSRFTNWFEICGRCWRGSCLPATSASRPQRRPGRISCAFVLSPAASSSAHSCWLFKQLPVTLRRSICSRRRVSVMTIYSTLCL